MSAHPSSLRRSKLISRRTLRKYSWLPDVIRIKDSIIPRAIGPILTVTAFAAIISYLWSQGKSLTLTNSVVPLLAVVVGLLLVFRNGTSYDRYYEGRRDIGTMISNIRNLSRLIWINVSVPQTHLPANLKGKSQLSSDLTATQLRQKKMDAIRLCLAFAFAVKHYLRGEDGLDWDDYRDTIPSYLSRLGTHDTMSISNPKIPSYAATSTRPISPTPSKAEYGNGPNTPDATKRVRVKRSKHTMSVRSSLLQSGIEYHDAIDVQTDVTMPLPLILAHEISHMLFQFKRDGYLETVGPAGANAMHLLVQSMVDQVTNMERIVNTPIPKSYSIHLKQCVTLYLFALPFTLIKELGWGTIPVVTVVAFTFMGIEAIADEIEMPFGDDEADLPVDRYISDLKEEILFLFQRLPEGGQGIAGFDDGEGDD